MILIATSIAPGARIAVQVTAVQSWLDMGFAVASLNAPEEIDALQGQFPGVEFIPQLRTGKLEASKPVIYISELLHHLRQSGRQTVGIVNSDIFLPPNRDLMDFAAENSKGGLLFGPRQEVQDFGASEGKMDPFGFDYFFMDATILRIWPESRFCLGMPFWDLWFPLVPIFAGLPAKKLISPVAKHIPHPTQRDDSFFLFNNEFAGAVMPVLGGGETYRKLVAEASTPDALERLAVWLDGLTRTAISHIERCAEKIELG
ncbi:MAG: hypothetical protein HOH80_06070 [Rhodospirillaceae bacterium]|nr:hypothetical protein [Rhodospirillaceae bacterium]